jgi:Secreted protein acidic and rich in cysteine Ca binding region
MVLPCEQPYLRAHATQRTAYTVTEKDSLPYDVERMLATLIEKELRFFKEQEKLKADLVTRFDFSMQEMFKELDDWNYKYIDMKNLKRFLIKTSVYPDDSALKAIIRRCDTDGDARLSYREFQMAVQPMTAFKSNLDLA